MSTRKIEAFGYFKDGKLHIMNRHRMEEDMRHMPDCDIELIIKKRGKRTSQANRYYHAVVVEEVRIRLRELGHELDHDEVHEFLKVNFNSTSIASPQGEAIQVPRSTTEMNKEEFSLYIERIRDWAYDKLEIWIPEASTQTQMFKVA